MLFKSLLESTKKDTSSANNTISPYIYRIVREDDSQAKYGRLMMYFGLVVMFMLISGWSSMIEPMVLHG